MDEVKEGLFGVIKFVSVVIDDKGCYTIMMIMIMVQRNELQLDKLVIHF